MTLIGILGGGQLARMLALAGIPLGLRFRVLDPAADAPAAPVAEHMRGAYDDEAVLAQFASGLQVVTYEFENVPVASATYLSRHVPVFPPPAALAAAQDRLAEKQFFNHLGIPTAPFAAIHSRTELDAALATIGLPAVLKTCRLGYDGKGQVLLKQPADVAAAWLALGGVPLILEGFVPFRRELSIIAVRGREGSVVCYPLTENVHQGGILRHSRAPAPGVSAELQALAAAYASRALAALAYVGVLAIELFEVGEAGSPRLVANEMAPRVHNSGHWMIEGAETSQFENHLRAILGLPLGTTSARGHVAMLNLLGTLPDPAAVLAVPGAHLHLYGKQPRPGRKLGHITLRAESEAELEAALAHVAGLI